MKNDLSNKESEEKSYDVSASFRFFNVTKGCKIQKTLSKIYHTLCSLRLVLLLKSKDRKSNSSYESLLRSKIEKIISSYQSCKICRLDCKGKKDKNFKFPRGNNYLGEEFLIEVKKLVEFVSFDGIDEKIKKVLEQVERWRKEVLKDTWEMWEKNQALVFYYHSKFRGDGGFSQEDLKKMQGNVSWGVLKSVLRYFPCSDRTFSTYAVNWSYHSFKKGMIEEEGRETFNGMVCSLDAVIDNGKGEKMTLAEFIDSSQYSEDPTPEETLEMLQQRDLVKEVLNTLPQNSRKVIVYRIVYDLTLEEIARKMGKSKEWVRKMLEVAKKQFIFEWKKRGFGEPLLLSE